MVQCETITQTLPASVKYAPVLGSTLAALLDETTAESYNIQLAVHELFTNIVEHGYGLATGEQVVCTFTLSGDKRCFTAVLQDEAPAFAPNQVGWENAADHWETAVTPQGHCHTLKTTPEPDLLQERGRGFFLISQLTDSLICHATLAGNEWTLQKTW